ncbi:MAG: hypothetical protein ABR860_15195 [Terracidiphilus sp.]
MMEANACGRWGEPRLRGKPVKVPLHVAQQHPGKVMGEPVAHYDALNHSFIAICGHAIGRHLPTPVAQAV